MPAGVVFVVFIPSGNHEHMLKFGKAKNEATAKNVGKEKKPYELEMHLHDKSSESCIPVRLTQHCKSDLFDDVIEDKEFITMEDMVRELLKKMHVEHAVWTSDQMGNFFEVVFPLTAGDRCETMLHCLTKLGVGVRHRSTINVLPCSVVYSALDLDVANYEEALMRKSEETKRWRNFVESIRSKLTVKQVVDGVRGGGELCFDYLTLIVTADSLAALGLVENNASNIMAAMLVSPLMAPVMSITFGAIIADKSLVRSGFESLAAGMLVSLLFGFIFGLVLGSTEMPWGVGDFPTEEMKTRGNVRSLWMGVLWALTSGTGVALALLQGSAGPLIGVAISASLLPPVVNCGLYWALACICLLYPDVKLPHLSGEKYYGNSSYEPLYHDYIPIEFAVNGIVSCCLTLVNIVCIFITAIILLKIKEVSAPYTSSLDLRRFWEQDIKVARRANRATALKQTEEDERAQLVMDDLNQEAGEDMKEKLEVAVQEALDDETYRRVKRMSYQSHNADELVAGYIMWRIKGWARLVSNAKKIRTSQVIHSMGLHTHTSTPRKSTIGSGILTPQMYLPKTSNIDEIATLDRLLASLLGNQKRIRSYNSHCGTPRFSYLPMTDEPSNRNHDVPPDRMNENTIIQDVLVSLRSQEQGWPVEDSFMTPK